jgi:hypothetical protein
VTFQSRFRFELVTANAARLIVLIGRCDLVVRKLLPVGKVGVALVAIVMLVSILLMTLHSRLCFEGLIAIFIRALDLMKWLEWHRHLGLFSA